MQGALSCYVRRQEQGDVFAQNDLGGVYEHGFCGPVDEAEAERWYRKAADQGFPLAQSNLAALRKKKVTKKYGVGT